jgi:hypothetical protein
MPALTDNQSRVHTLSVSQSPLSARISSVVTATGISRGLEASVVVGARDVRRMSWSATAVSSEPLGRILKVNLQDRYGCDDELNCVNCSARCLNKHSSGAYCEKSGTQQLVSHNQVARAKLSVSGHKFLSS